LVWDICISFVAIDYLGVRHDQLRNTVAIPEFPNVCVGGGGWGRSVGGVLIINWKLSSVAGSFGM